MTIQYTLEPADMMAFQVHHRKHSPQYKRMRYITVIVFTGLSLQLALTKHHDLYRQVVAFCIAMATYFVVIWLMGHLFRLVASWRSFTPEKYPGLFCEHTITLQEDAVVEVTDVSECRNLWSGIHSVVNTTKYIYIFITENMAHMIPKRAFSNGEMADAFFQKAVQLHSGATRKLTAG